MGPLPSADKLSIYLNDHRAGATAGHELARRLAGSNRGNDYGAALAELATEIGEDRAALVEVMDRLAIRRDPLKLAVSWAAEKAGRLKLNGGLIRYSPLSRLEELELLGLGVQAKLALWEALRHTHGEDSRLRRVKFDELIERARSQRRRLDRLRRRAAKEALGPAG
ncbi:MAG: hypothetical protein E6G56_01335 [Actinobacteria bacterium]|nr:MAG: hypothetical protein E6G56_01335 [Actinomycetota bacterium]